MGLLALLLHVMRENKMLTLLITIALSCPSDQLLDAIREVESNGNVCAVGDGGNAVGAYQIHKIYVDDVNRIAGTNYTYDDRLDERKSREMVKIYLTHYGKGLSEFDLCRLHVGGPDGHKQACTLSYANKVMAILKGE